MHYNTSRPHQGIAQRVPYGEHDGGHLTVVGLGCGPINRKTRPGGLIDEYSRRPISRRTAGQDTDAIFERDRIGRTM